MRRQRLAVCLSIGMCGVICGLPATGAPSGATLNRYVEDFTTTTYKDTVNTTANWDTTAGELGILPFVPSLVGAYDTPGTAWGLAVAGDLAVVADYDQGLQLIDITDPSAPTLVGIYNTPGNALAVVVEGNLAIVANGDYGLQLIDISNPSAPTLLGACDTPAYAFALAVAGDFAFVADYDGGLQVVDVSDPGAPTLAGSFNTVGTAFDVALAGDFAFVADADAGLQVIDISNPGAPTPAATSDTPGYAKGVASAGEFAFLADNNAGLQVIQTFQHELDTGHNVGQSVPVDGGTDTIVRARLTSTETPDISWELSADAGTHWYPFPSDNTWVAFTVAGDDLRWRSTHTWSPWGNSTVSNLTIEWLNEFGLITSITDIPNDQGRQVSVEWIRSGHDFLGDPLQIVEYGVYRKIDPGLGALEAQSTLQARQDWSPAVREHALMMEAAGWHFLVTVPVRVEDSYAVVVPTLEDSTISAGQYLTTFRVTAFTATPGVYFDSPPDSGYSVDNLSPGVPQGFSVAYNTGGGNTLSWDEAREPDFQYYRVYRSQDPGFIPAPGDLVHETATPGWTDPDYDGGTVYYKITALDFAGNESDPATPGAVTAAADKSVPTRFALSQNVPNPFNPFTTIRYSLPEASEVTLIVYDAAGRRVRTRVDRSLAAGSYEASWDGLDSRNNRVASGVYFYRLRAGAFVQTSRMVLIR
jgi:hypothetical protein